MKINIEKELNDDIRDACCFIIGAGEFYGLSSRVIREEGRRDLVIAADGGLVYTERLSLTPDIIIGDFDSYDGSCGTSEQDLRERAGISADSGALIRLSPVKDESDLAAALSEGIRRGFKTFLIYGCTGGRPDHTFSAIQDIARLSKEGIKAFLFARDYVITAVSEGSVEFPEYMKGMISVFSHTDLSEGVTESGLKYTVADHELSNDFPLGLSNEFTGIPAIISVKKGTLIIMFETGRSGESWKEKR